MAPFLDSSTPTSETSQSSFTGENQQSWSNDAATQATPIAVCGMALRLPGGISTPEDFWHFLINKQDARAPVPETRYNASNYHSKLGKPGHVRTDYGYFLDESIDLGALDSTFFSMPKIEVERIDPQQRLLLELTRECLESAGETDYRGKTIGTFVGSFGEDWLERFSKDDQVFGLYKITGYQDFVLANRISYEYDLRGPSITIRTACSSGLIGIHEACLAIRTGQCNSAIVGGSNLIMAPQLTINMSEQGVLSPNASCRTFDANADGYARAEAVNCVYLKKLEDAIRDGNPIRAIIRGSCSNADGKTVGLSVPNSVAHEEMIRRAYAMAGITDVNETAFVECHGTGTKVGDPIETTAIASVFGDRGVYIGSVKPNVGHSEGASGITSLIKSVLALEHNTIPPNIKFDVPNPKIPFEERKLKVPLDATPWPQDRSERISVNSFGIGGANVHVILDSATSFLEDFHSLTSALSCSSLVPAITPIGATISPESSSPTLAVFSANTADSLRRQVVNQQKYIEEHIPESLEDIVYTLGARRTHLPHRAFSLVGAGMEPNTSPFTKAPAMAPEVVMVFTGQGAQWAQMGIELFQANSTFAATIHQMDKTLATLPDPPTWTIVDELMKSKETSNLSKAAYSQPICTALQVALVAALANIGIHPQAVVGHSSGEMAAAYASGRLSVGEAIIAAYYRGIVSDEVTREGGMAALGLGWDEASSFLIPGVIVACENSPSSVTISGDIDSLKQVLQRIHEAKPDVLARLLKVDKAYHSHHMKEVGDRYEALVSRFVNGSSKEITDSDPLFFSSVLCKKLSNEDSVGASYWRSNLESPVRFRTAVSNLVNDYKSRNTSSNTNLVFLEVGPHSALSGPLRQTLAQASLNNVPYSSCLIRSKSSAETFLTAVGQLWTHNVAVDFNQLTNPCGTARVIPQLPTYPWQHTQSHLFDTRLARMWRESKFPRHELLGVRVAQSTDNEPSWRVVLVLDHVPWIRDHNIKGDVIFPCAGYVGIVGEAARQMCINTSPDGDKFAGFSLRNVVIDTAMVLNDTKSTEIVTSLRRYQLTDSLDSIWYNFTISSFNGTAWTRHCIGQVCARTVRPSAILKTRQAVTEKLARSVDVPKWYQVLANVGANYGPFFQGLKDISCSTIDHVARATAIHTSEDDEVDYSIHPTKIDFFLQLFSVAAFKGVGRKMDRMAVPTSIESMDVYRTSSELNMLVEANVTTRGAIHGAGKTCDMDGHLALSMEGVKLSPLDNDATEENPDPHAGARISWMPDVDFLKVVDLVKPNQEQAVFMPQLQQLTLLCIKQSLERLEKIDTATALPCLCSFVEWMKKQPLPTTEETIEALVETLSATTLNPLMAGVMKVFENLEPIIRGEAEALEVLMLENSLGKIYDYLNNCDRRPLFQALGHAKPNMRILEIGAGTGGTTQIVLDYLVNANKAGQRLYSQYTYTDISAGFFAAAQDRFKSYPNMSFQALDISRDPAEQNFQPGSFDLILAANVLHATPRLRETLANVRKLLKPDGLLYLEELCSEVKPINYIMGVLPGWWLGNADGRPDEPYISPERWHQELSASGFAGLDDFVLDSPSPNQLLAFMTAKPAVEPSRRPNSKITLLLHDGSDECIHTVKALVPVLLKAGYEISTWNFPSQGLPPTENDLISLLDVHVPFFENITESNYDAFRELTVKLSASVDNGSGGAGLLWLTRASQVQCKDPRWGQIVGAARTIRGELSIHFATCELENITEPKTWDLVGKVFQKFHNRGSEETMGNNAADLLPEYEYAIVDGQVWIPRVYPVNVKDELKTVSCGGETAVDYELKIGKYGRLDTMHWSAKQERKLGSDEVMVDVKSVSLNFKDVLIAMGIVDSNFNSLGLEGAGVIRSIGDDVKDLSLGDRVFFFGGGCFSTGVISHAKLCVKIPDSLSFEEAAGMPTVFSTVIRGVLDLGRLQSDETILIHSACGGVGLAAIQIAKMIGAEIFCTVSSEEKINHLMVNYGIPRDHIFQSRDSSFQHDVLEATNGRGVDIVLNSLSGELLHASWECVATFGRMIEIGKRDLIGNGKLALNIFELNRSYYGVDLGHLVEVRHGEANRLLKEIIRLYEEGHIQPVRPIQTWPAKSAEECFRYMQKGKHIGKIVVSIDREDIKAIATNPQKKVAFKSDASYLLAGGLGGLGKVVSTWMVEQGARSLVYLAPEAGKSLQDQGFLEELRSQGCSATAIDGSVSLLSDVERAIAAAPFPIKGVLNMCMVLRDQGFSAMTHDEWTACVEPKVQGTWILHQAFEKTKTSLDFFGMFSSISGIIGQRGQANYASANTFLDAFVQYRKQLGLPACAVDVGAMLDHGYVAENSRLRDRMQGQGWYGIRVPELLDALSAAILSSNTSLPLLSHNNLFELPSRDLSFSNPSQLIIGMRSLTALDDPANRVIWKTDRRMSIYHNTSSSSTTSSSLTSQESSTNNPLTSFLASASTDPSILQSSTTAPFIGRQIAKHLLKLLLRPVDNDDEIDVHQSLQDIGLDSLVAIEMRGWWKGVFGFDISVLEMLGSGSVLALGEKAVERLVGKFEGEGESGEGKHTADMILETKMP